MITRIDKDKENRSGSNPTVRDNIDKNIDILTIFMWICVKIFRFQKNDNIVDIIDI